MAEQARPAEPPKPNNTLRVPGQLLRGAPSVSLDQEMVAVRHVLQFMAADTNSQLKAAALIEYILMYSHGMVNSPEPFTARAFENRTLYGMNDLGF